MFYDFLRLHHQDSNAFSFVVVVVPRIVTNIRDTKIFRAVPTTPLTACVCLPAVFVFENLDRAIFPDEALSSV